MTLRVLHIVNSLERGGLEQLVCSLALHRGAKSTSVLCLRRLGVLGRGLRHRGVDVTLLGEHQRQGPALLYRLSQFLRRRRPDIVHCHNLPALTLGGLAARCCRIPGLVFTKHGASHPARGRADRLRRWLARHAQVVAVSPEIQQLMKDWLPRCRLPVRYVPNGVDLESFRKLPDRASIRAAHGWSNEEYLIGMVARLNPVKDHVGLIHAFAAVHQQHPAARLLLIGDGPLRGELEQLVDQLQLRASVQLLGDRGEIPQLLTALDLFVLSSHSEGIPVAILEAMAARVPVVATRVGGVPSVVSHKQTGWLVDPGARRQLVSGILQIATHPELGKQFADQAYQRVEADYDLPRVVDRYERIYESLC